MRPILKVLVHPSAKVYGTVQSIVPCHLSKSQVFLCRPSILLFDAIRVVFFIRYYPRSTSVQLFASDVVLVRIRQRSATDSATFRRRCDLMSIAMFLIIVDVIFHFVMFYA